MAYGNFEQHLPWQPKTLHILDLIYTSLNEHKDTITGLGLIHWNAANAEPFILPQNIRTSVHLYDNARVEPKKDAVA
jgi:hypothetical protein